MIDKLKKENTLKQTAKCKHCGGPLRDYRYSVSCLMCGRAEDHICERCRYSEEELMTKKVA